MWSPQQTKALDAVGSWIQSKNKPYFLLSGYAGTGKTTLAKHLVSSVKGKVYFAAFTGIAAHVLTKAGAPNVSTIHKLIYKPKDRSHARLKELEAQRAELLTHDPIPHTLLKKVDAALKIEKENLERPFFQLDPDSPLSDAALVVVDECFMVDGPMGKDILSFGCPVLALGDPGQLPPIYGDSFFKANEADVTLTEIHRQAQDNPIIQMASRVRSGSVLKPGGYGESRVIPYGHMDRDELKEMVLGCDQLLVGKNSTRISSNNRVRELLGRKSELPEKGDKLVCLRNNHDIGLLNGQLWTAQDDALAAEKRVLLDLKGEGGARVEVSAHPHYFYGNKPEFWERKDAEEFDYGYALTVHKAQGSQWENVVLFDEWRGQDRSKWLYTGITRAAERITVINM